MNVPHIVDAQATLMPWLPDLELGAIYQFKGERPLFQFSDGEMHEVPGAKKTIFELVTLLDLDGTVKRGDLFTPAYRWTQDDEVFRIGTPMQQPDSRTGLGYLNPHECPVCGQMHYSD